jgi:hypothetical protein
MRFGATSITIHCLALYAIMFIELCFNFMYVFFCIFIPHVVSYFFPYLTTSLSWTILSQVGLLEIPMTYMGSLDYFLAQGLVLPDDCSSKRLMLNEGSRVCSLLSLILYPKRVYFASLTLIAEYWGFGRRMPLNKAIIITYSVAVNYPCLVSWLRVVSHNRTKYKENKTRE